MLINIKPNLQIHCCSDQTVPDQITLCVKIWALLAAHPHIFYSENLKCGYSNETTKWPVPGILLEHRPKKADFLVEFLFRFLNSWWLVLNFYLGFLLLSLVGSSCGEEKNLNPLASWKDPNLSYKWVLDLFIQDNDGIFHAKSILCCRNDLAIALLPLLLIEYIAVREREGYAGLTLSHLTLKDGFPLQEGFGFLASQDMVYQMNLCLSLSLATERQYLLTNIT